MKEQIKFKFSLPFWPLQVTLHASLAVFFYTGQVTKYCQGKDLLNGDPKIHITLMNFEEQNATGLLDCTQWAC